MISFYLSSNLDIQVLFFLMFVYQDYIWEVFMGQVWQWYMLFVFIGSYLVFFIYNGGWEIGQLCVQEEEESVLGNSYLVSEI